VISLPPPSSSVPSRSGKARDIATVPAELPFTVPNPKLDTRQRFGKDMRGSRPGREFAGWTLQIQDSRGSQATGSITDPQLSGFRSREGEGGRRRAARQVSLFEEVPSGRYCGSISRMRDEALERPSGCESRTRDHLAAHDLLSLAGFSHDRFGISADVSRASGTLASVRALRVRTCVRRCRAPVNPFRGPFHLNNTLSVRHVDKYLTFPDAPRNRLESFGREIDENRGTGLLLTD